MELRDGASRTTRERLIWLPVLLALLVLSLGLTGCIVGVRPPAYSDTALGVVRASQGATALDVEQTLDEYGLFFSTDRDDVVAIDEEGRTGTVLASIVTNPDVKQVRVLLTHTIAASEVGTLTVDAKRLTPGATYYYRFYTIGRDGNGVVRRTLFTVGNHVTADPTLKSLARSKGTLSPAFSKTKYAYKNTISRTTASSRITVVPTLSGAAVEMKVDAGAWGTTRSKVVSVSRVTARPSTSR
jgi:Tfp pilus assembly protein PilV